MHHLFQDRLVPDEIRDRDAMLSDVVNDAILNVHAGSGADAIHLSMTDRIGIKYAIERARAAAVLGCRLGEIGDDLLWVRVAMTYASVQTCMIIVCSKQKRVQQMKHM